MKITLDIQDKSLSKFLELIGSLDYVSVSEEQEIPQAQIDEVNRRLELIAKGEMKTRSWEDAKRDIFKR
ncbi:MAG: addiction module protein [Flavobacteriales bacterium]|nr:addiction module protein [Flavobacteriales bacterium]